MCTEYQSIDIVGGVTITGTIVEQCSEKPTTGTVKDCPRYKLVQARYSRQQENSPGRAKGGDAASA